LLFQTLKDTSNQGNLPYSQFKTFFGQHRDPKHILPGLSQGYKPLPLGDTETSFSLLNNTTHYSHL